MWKLCGWLLFLASAGDGISTELALQVPGAHEQNLLLQNRWARVSAHAIAPAVIYWQTEKLYPEHRVLAWTLRIATIALWSYATVHNLRQWRGPP